MERRLEALLAAEREAEGADLARLAKRAGVGRTTFFRLRKSWSEDRSLEAVTPYSSRKDPDPLLKEVHSPFVAAARELLALDPSATDRQIVQSVMERLPSGPSINTAVRLLELLRREASSDEVDLLRDYGARLAIDILGVSAPLGGAPGGRVEVALGVVMEAASGLVLGWRVAPVGSGLRAQQDAILRATRSVRECRLDRADDQEALQIDICLAPTNRATDSLSAELRMIGGVSLLHGGRGRYGSLALRHLDRQLGRLVVRPSALTRRGAGGLLKEHWLSADRLGNIDAMAHDAFAEHNRDRTAELRKHRLIGDAGVPDGLMYQRLNRLLQASWFNAAL